MRSAYMNFSGLIGYRAGSAGERRVIGAIPPYEITNNQTGRDVELPRGALTTLLYDVTEERQIRYRFNDSIETLEDDGAGIEIQFESGERHRYDVVIGADGLHSRARRLVFGPEERFNHYLGCCFNIFSMPNDMGLPHGGIIYSEVGRTAGGFAVRDSKDVFGFIIFASDKPPFGAHPDVEEQYQRTEAVFADGGWEAPRLLKAMRRAEDLYFDTVSQIRMPVWSSGRVVLVGDAAYAPVSWRRETTLRRRSPPMSESPSRLSKPTKPWRQKATVSSSCRARLERLKRATGSWRPSLRGKASVCETTMRGKCTACCAFPITPGGFMRNAGETRSRSPRRIVGSSHRRRNTHSAARNRRVRRAIN
jgi:hypothetical protein